MYTSILEVALTVVVFGVTPQYTEQTFTISNLIKTNDIL